MPNDRQAPDLFQHILLRLQASRTEAEIIATVRSAARAALCADGVTFVLRDGERCHYVEEDALSPLWKGQEFPMSHCISGWAMLNRKTTAIADVFADPRIPHDVYRRTFVQSLIMAPVGLDQAVAAIGAYWSYRRNFSQADIEGMERLAAAVSQALAGALAA